jgi:hypothetical protein
MSKRTKHTVNVQDVIKLMPSRMQSEILELDSELKRLRNERGTK